METKKLLRRIFAWVALIAAVAAGVFISLFFFNLFGESSDIFATLSLICAAVTAVFFILAKYVFADPEPLEEPAGDTDGGEEEKEEAGE